MPKLCYLNIETEASADDLKKALIKLLSSITLDDTGPIHLNRITIHENRDRGYYTTKWQNQIRIKTKIKDE